jgi:hypothetical protein
MKSVIRNIELLPVPIANSFAGECEGGADCPVCKNLSSRKHGRWVIRQTHAKYEIDLKEKTRIKSRTRRKPAIV